MMRECPYSTSPKLGIGKSIPDALEISRDPRVLGNLSVVGDGFPDTSLVLLESGYNTSLRRTDALEECKKFWNQIKTFEKWK